MNAHLTAQVTQGFTEVFGSYSTDAVIILVLLGVFFVYGFFIGKNRLTSLILTLYLCGIVFWAFPYTSNVSLIRSIPNAAAWSALIVFAIFCILVQFPINRIILTADPFTRPEKILEVGVLSVSALILCIGIAYTILPIFSHLLVFSAPVAKLIHFEIVPWLLVTLPLGGIWWTNR